MDTVAVFEKLKSVAQAASANSYSPYSQYRVGAAVLLPDGQTYAACNVESASFGLTQCAERNALGTAIADGVRPGTAVALLIYLPGTKPLPPCGACRQVMAELMSPESLVISCCDGDDIEQWALGELLPHAFLPGEHL